MPAVRPIVAAACLLAFLTAGCDSSPPSTAAGTPAPAASTSIATVPGTDAPSPAAASTSAAASPVSAVDKEIVVTVAKRKVTPPTGRIEVGKGGLVRITVTSDVADELHVHGYDKTLTLPAGTPASLDLRVDRTGLFEVETHSSHLVLFQLVVR
ncbi:hypothetical protein OHA72_59640 [Dactylosporangium sp. NBC_01737]|uniref:hypothetical protein n=1 Tax=Dactylosporangium sp. NBC_01737 TaxID=2975959 RepID=UPI002E0FE8BB|nr:hypothetical protein OHA72_59640 [Dactylosporangium sp. NBC_01737]